MSLNTETINHSGATGPLHLFAQTAARRQPGSSLSMIERGVRNAGKRVRINCKGCWTRDHASGQTTEGYIRERSDAANKVIQIRSGTRSN